MELNAKMEVPVRDVMELTQMEWLRSVPEAEQRYRIGMSASNGGIKDVDGLRRRIAEYIQLRSFGSIPVRKERLNQQFSPSARKQQTTVTEIVCELLAAGVITEIERGRMTVLYSASVLREQVERQAQNAIIDKVEAHTLITELYERLVENAKAEGHK